MRLAPVPIRYADLIPDKLDELVRYFIESSLPTHSSPQCLSACAYVGLVLYGLIHGLDRQEVLANNWEPLATEANPLLSSRGRGRRRWELSAQEAAPDCRLQVRGEKCGSRPVGVSRRHGFPGGRPASGEPGRRCRHHGSRLRATCRMAVRARDSEALTQTGPATG
jgi:hypothetical protein